MINPTLDTIISYASKDVAARVARDPNVINLSIGEPDFGPPKYAILQLSRMLETINVLEHLKHYDVSRGSEDLRREIAHYYLKHYQLVYDSGTQILVTHGGSGGLTMALLTISQAGDEILIPDPAYTLYERLVSILGRTPVKTRRLANNGFTHDLDSIAKSITSKTRALIINSPENPTGYICSVEEMKALVQICRNTGIWLIHDEVYDQFAFDKPHVPASQIADSVENVILVNSLSKKFGVPGLRIGWLVSSDKFISAAAKSQDYCSLALNKTTEQVAEILLGSSESIQWFSDTRSVLSKRLRKLHGVLNETLVFEFPCIPQGGMFLFPRVSKLADLISDNHSSNIAKGEVVSTWLLNNVKVATIPGSVYGRESRDFIRIVGCVDPNMLDTAMKRIADAVLQLVNQQ
jgi:aspartate/methionine/tyrosine aminotransferase